jgi:hypothetical protein
MCVGAGVHRELPIEETGTGFITLAAQIAKLPP